MKVLSLEQMNKLKELGVNVTPKSLGLIYSAVGGDYKLMHGQSVCEDDMKAFVLQDVIELLPIENIDIRRNCHEKWVISYKDEITFKSEFMIDAAYNMLIWVIENNYLKTK
jgi:hypothetical protein